MSFDFGDCRHYALSSAQHFWMGRRYQIPRYSWFRYKALCGGKGGDLWDLLWFDSGKESETYQRHVNKLSREDFYRVNRTFELIRGRSFVVTDDITCRKPSEIRSSFHTQAGVELSPDKRQATLRQSGKSFVVSLLAPEDAAFEVLPAPPGPLSPNPVQQASNDGRRKLAVILKDVKSTRIQVMFSPPPDR